MKSVKSVAENIHLRRFPSLLPFVLLLAGVAILGGDVVFRGRVLSGPDLVNLFLPPTVFAREWLQRGVLPLWNSMTFCGWPLVGDPQLRWFYPPNLLFLVADPVRVFSFLMIGYIAFSAIGMWFYLRRAAGVGPWPALCGAATMALAGFFPCYLMSGIVVFPPTGAWIPWILLIGWRIGQPRSSPAMIALFAAAVVAQILSGAPQIVFYTWIAVVLQAIWCSYGAFTRTYGSEFNHALALRSAGGVVLRYAAGVALGIALGASSLIPSNEFGALSLQRGGKTRWEYVSECSLAPRFLWLTVAPRFFGDPRIEGAYWGGQEGYWEICGYSGIGPLIALLVIFLSWRSLFGNHPSARSSPFPPSQQITPRAFSAFHLTLAALALFLALGGYNPVYRWLYQWVPGFDRFRVPSRWLLIWQFSLATLLALVLEKLWAEPTESPILKKRTILAAGCFVAFLVLAALPAPDLMRATGIVQYFRDFDPSSGRLLDLQLRNWTAGSLWRAAGFSLAWLILLIIAGKRIHPPLRRTLPVFGGLLVLADVLSFSAPMPATRTRQGQVDEFYPRSPLVDFLAANLKGHRFLATDDVHAWWNDQNQPELFANRATLAGLRDARGYFPLCLGRFGHFINALNGRPAQFPMGSYLSVGATLNPSFLSMLDVKFLLSYENLTIRGLRLAQRTSFGLNIYEVVASRGPAFAVQAYPADGLSDDEEIALLTQPGLDWQNFALASEPPPDWDQMREQGSPRPVGFVRLTPTRIALAVQVGAGDLVVVSEAYHPGWSATLDGQPAKVIRANHALIGVYVPPGEHAITLTFRPASFRLGFYLSLAALLVLAALTTATFRWRRPTLT